MEKPNRREKLPYSSPRMVEYGSLVRLTGGILWKWPDALAGKSDPADY